MGTPASANYLQVLLRAAGIATKVMLAGGRTRSPASARLPSVGETDPSGAAASSAPFDKTVGRAA
jgi:hypothetical protein